MLEVTIECHELLIKEREKKIETRSTNRVKVLNFFLFRIDLMKISEKKINLTNTIINKRKEKKEGRGIIYTLCILSTAS
jgi:hypothetical protein